MSNSLSSSDTSNAWPTSSSSSDSEIDIEDSLLPKIYQLVQSPLVQGPSLEGLLQFFKAYLKSGAEAKPLLKQLGATAVNAEGGKKAVAGQEGIQNLVTASRCIGMIVKESKGSVGEEVVKDNEKILKVSLGISF